MILFVSFDKSVSTLMLNDTITDLNDTNTTFSQNIKGTVTVMDSAWKWIPIFALLGLLYYGFKSAMGGDIQ